MNSIKLLTTLPVILTTFGLYVNAQSDKPNVIFILTDDQGYGDLSCHGNPWLKTPHLDKLHSESVRFTNFHVGTTSSPTRAGLMSGKYNNSVGVWHTVSGLENLSADEVTLIDVLKGEGYRTGIFGKWHLGDNYPFRPQDRGFEEVLVHKAGGIGQQPDFWNNDYFDDTYFHNGNTKKFKGYCTDIWFQEAKNFISKNINNSFFCYISLNAPHSPFYVPEKYVQPYLNNPDIVNPKFYGMISNIDKNVGLLRQFLDENGLSDNTILVFMTDNGTSAGVQIDKNGFVVKGFNAGMRGLKGWSYDGGHRVPFFVHYPAKGINKGKDINEIASFVDFMPTILDMCGIEKVPKTDIHGISLWPLLTGEKATLGDRLIFTDTQRETLLRKWKSFAVMTNRWRLTGKNELYDMLVDPGQTKNVAGLNPGVVEELIDAYESWWKQTTESIESINHIKLGHSKENPSRLDSHDLRTEDGLPPYDQIHVRNGTGANGHWAVDFVKSGFYLFDLCRWPKESKLKMNEAAPDGGDVEGDIPFPKGVVITNKHAVLMIGEDEYHKDIKDPSAPVRFKVFVKEGQVMLKTILTDLNDVSRPAYYVYVKATND